METHATIPPRLDDLRCITPEPDFLDSGNERRLEWAGTIGQWDHTSVTEVTYKRPVPDNATLRQWARGPNSAPPASWWDADEDPFEPESE